MNTLTTDERSFLEKLSAEKANQIINILPYSPKIKETAEQIVNEIKEKLPQAVIRFLGASGLGISGQNDIDLYLLAQEKEFDNNISELEKLFGEPKGKSLGSVAWKFERDGFEVEFYLTDPKSNTMQRQLNVYEILKNNSDLLAKYEKLKEGLSGKTFREYQEAKYEFYHWLINEVSTNIYTDPGSGETVRFEYRETESFDDLELSKVRQVYGVCFSDEKMVVVKLKLSWGLPGGTPEAGESIEETLRREIKEETNMEVISWKPIGVQKVIRANGEYYFQLRTYCKVAVNDEFVEDPDGDVSEVKLIDPEEYKSYFDWGEIGERIIKRAREFDKVAGVQ